MEETDLLHLFRLLQSLKLDIALDTCVISCLLYLLSLDPLMAID